MTTVNDFTDILRIIREQPEWADALRSALLGKDVLEMPQRLAVLTAAFTEFAEAANKRFATLESDVAELKVGQARLEGAVSRLEGTVSRLEGTVSQMQGDIGNLRGVSYETSLGRKVDSILAQRLRLRGVRLIKGSLAGNNTMYLDLIDAAADRGDITEQERGEINETDFILRGRNRIDQSTVFVVVEASVTAGDSDIDRAAERSEILRRATGETSIATVVSAQVDSPRQRLAEERNVILIAVRE